MKTLLIIAPHPELAENVRSGLDPQRYRVLHRTSVDEAEPLLAQGVADACIIDVELTSPQSVWLLDRLNRRAPNCPILIYTDTKQWEWEEEAYLRGVAHVLTKPVRIRMLTAVLERVWPVVSAKTSSPVAESVSASPLPAASILSQSRPTEGLPVVARGVAAHLGVLRNFSEILTHSLDSQAMLKQFLQLLRETLGINRAAIFLRQPATSLAGGLAVQQGTRMRSAYAMGLSPGLLEHFELSFDSGIGGQLVRLGRILKLHSAEALSDSQAQKEFELLGGQVAVPILDRESLIGVGVFDARVTGEALSNPELEMIFHLLEQLALGIKNIWLHDQLTGNHELMAGILRELSSACLVVNHDLAVLHANKMARKYFGRVDRPAGQLEFSDLPPLIGSKIYQVLKTGSAVSNFKFEPENGAATVYNLNIVPFQKLPSGLPSSALLMAEDLTQTVQFQRLEIEAANLRLVKSMADRLTHEIGNALVPLSTHQQLLAEKWKDPEFRASLDTAMGEGVKRIARLTSQMRFLAQDSVVSADAFPVAPLIEEAFQEARKYQPVKAAQLKYETGSKPIIVTGNRAALKHALAEVMLNALQANPEEPKIGVRLNADMDNGKHGLHIEVQDNGSGFSPEAVKKAVVPFFTTRNVGLGLGLTVTRKIVETHHGRLEIVSPKTGHAGVVRISLPLDSSRENKTETEPATRVTQRTR